MEYNSKTGNNIGNSLKLPCGAVLKNRLVKSPMSDSLGNGEGNPTDEQIRLYERWAEGGVALSIIGEVQGTPDYPEKPGNLVLTGDIDQKMFELLTSKATIDQAHLWVQLGHAGALSYAPISHPMGPSSLNIEGLQCDGMSIDDIQKLPEMYSKAAKLAKEVGFTGVLLHAGHGFLLSQFLSPLFNQRNDDFGGTIDNRCRIILEIIKEIRVSVGQSFPIGIRINSSDMLDGGLTESDSLDVIRLLNGSSVDLIDISGGTYFPGAKASSEGATKGPYFLGFAQRAREITDIPLMVDWRF